MSVKWDAQHFFRQSCRHGTAWQGWAWQGSGMSSFGRGGVVEGTLQLLLLLTHPMVNGTTHTYTTYQACQNQEGFLRNLGMRKLGKPKFLASLTHTKNSSPWKNEFPHLTFLTFSMAHKPGQKNVLVVFTKGHFNSPLPFTIFSSHIDECEMGCTAQHFF